MAFSGQSQGVNVKGNRNILIQADPGALVNVQVTDSIDRLAREVGNTAKTDSPEVKSLVTNLAEQLQTQKNYGVHQGLRLVILGHTGEGKSASGNTILQRPKTFTVAKRTETGRSITKECGVATNHVFDRNVLVVDTPGLFDTSLSDINVMNYITQSIFLAHPGPHAFLYVISTMHTFTKEYEETINRLTSYFGDEIFKYIVVVFTHGDTWDEEDDIRDWFSNIGPVKGLLERCGPDRYVLLDNKGRDKDKQRSEVRHLFYKVEEAIKQNDIKGEGYYRSPLYQVGNFLIEEGIREQMIEAVKQAKASNSQILQRVRQYLEGLQSTLTDHAMLIRNQGFFKRLGAYLSGKNLQPPIDEATLADVLWWVNMELRKEGEISRSSYVGNLGPHELHPENETSADTTILISKDKPTDYSFSL